MNLYDFTVKTNANEDFDLKQLQGKVVLIVNVASKCGFTPQYKELETLYQTYKDQGLVILGFPCNQFGSQEPGSNEEIQSFCELNYGVTFPLMAKIDVNGEHADPLYQWLSNEQKGILGMKNIKWNFTKFLINKEGQALDRYAPTTKPMSMQDDIQKLL